MQYEHKMLYIDNLCSNDIIYLNILLLFMTNLNNIQFFVYYLLHCLWIDKYTINF